MWTNVINGFSNFAMKVATGETVQSISDISSQLSGKLSETFNNLDWTLVLNPYLDVLPFCLGITMLFGGLYKAVSLVKGTIFGA